jgi:hypothetical protein
MTLNKFISGAEDVSQSVNYKLIVVYSRLRELIGQSVNMIHLFNPLCYFQIKAKEVALEPGFPRIGLINGEQLVDILAEHWNDIPEEFREKLGLQVGLVPI